MPDPIDTEIRDVLVAYTGNEPPLSFTYDHVLGGGRRARRRRRITVAGAATAVIAVVAGVALHGADAAPAPYTVVGPSWSTLDAAPYCAAASAPPTSPLVKPTTVVNEKNSYPIRIPAEPADHAAARISCYLATAVPRLLPPGVTYHRSAETPATTMPLQVYPGRVFDPARPAVTVLDSTTASGYHLINVNAYRGGTIVTASAENSVPPGAAPGQVFGSGDLRPTRPDLPLTVAQLIDLICVPELDVFP